MFIKKNTRFKCISDKCNRIFSDIYTHLKHVKINHFEHALINQSFQYENTFSSVSADIPIPPYNNEESNSESGKNELLQIILKIVSDDRMPRKCAFGSIKELFNYHDIQINNVLKFLQLNQIENEELTSLLKSMVSPIEIKSEHLLLKHLTDHNMLINYEVIDIGSEFSFCYQHGNQIINKKYDFSYIIVDIEKLFFLLFSKTNLLSEVINYMKQLNSSSTFDNIIQSPFWKEKCKAFNPTNDNSQILIPRFT